MFWAALIPIIKAALVGAAVGGGTAAATGGDVKRGAAMGAAGGGLTSGFGSLLGGGSGGSAAGGTAGVSSGAAGGAASGAANAGFSQLLKKAMVDSAVSTGMGAATPQYGMAQVGNVPQMSPPDPMVQLQELMQKSQQRRIV